MVSLGYLAQAVLGTGTYVDGLACTPTVPATMTVNIGQGSIFAYNTIDATAYGSLPADAVDPLVKCGINAFGSIPFTLVAPTTSGQTISYLVEATFQEQDTSPIVLPYYNAAQPSQPFTGPNNSQVAQNTVRTQRVQLQLKAGAAAPAGSQVTPPVDTGWVGLYVITVNYGQTQITGANISVYPGAPFINPKLPQLGFLAGLLFSGQRGGVSMTQVWAGNPNGHVAGNAAGVNTPPDVCWDSLDKVMYVCIGTGTTSSAVWIVLETGFSNLASFGSPGNFTWTVPQGVYKVRVRGCGGGGGGSFGTSSLSGSGGGAGGYFEGLVSVTPGTVIPITIGAGGGPGTTVNATNGGYGGSSSFGSALAGLGGAGGSWIATGSAAGGQGGTYSLSGPGAISAWGTLGGFGNDGAGGGINGNAGIGGASFFGGGGRAAATSADLALNGAPFGSGGAGSYGSTAGHGGVGQGGVILIEY